MDDGKFYSSLLSHTRKLFKVYNFVLLNINFKVETQKKNLSVICSYYFLSTLVKLRSTTKPLK